MKKLFLIVTTGLIIISCGGRNNKTNGNHQAGIQTERTDANETSQAPDTHTAQNSLDVAGTYNGKFDHPGLGSIEFTITIEDGNKYTRTINGEEVNGNFNWETGSVIKFDTTEPNRFFVGENLLFLLEPEQTELPADWRQKMFLKKL